MADNESVGMTIRLDGTTSYSYSGLDRLEEIKPNFVADILSGDPETRAKVKEVIKIVNRMVDILNGGLNKPGKPLSGG